MLAGASLLPAPGTPGPQVPSQGHLQSLPPQLWEHNHPEGGHKAFKAESPRAEKAPDPTGRGGAGAVATRLRVRPSALERPAPAARGQTHTLPRGASQASRVLRDTYQPRCGKPYSARVEISKTFNHKREEGSLRQATGGSNTRALRASGEKPQPVLPPQLVPRGDVPLLRLPWPQELGCTCGGQGWDRALEFRAWEKLRSRMDWKALLSAASLLLPGAHGSDPSNTNPYCANSAAVTCTPGAALTPPGPGQTLPKTPSA